MPISDLLQEFGSAIPGAETLTVLSEAALEDQYLANFEKGYAAGWEDSLAMQIEEKSRLSETLTRNLEDLSFTYAEAFQQLLNDMVPVVQAAVAQLLPGIMGSALGPMIGEQVRTMLVQAGGGQRVEIRVPPGMSPQVTPVIGHALGGQVDVVEDNALTDGQAAIRIGNRESDIDLPAAIAAIQGAVAAFASDFEAVNLQSANKKSEVQYG